MGMKCPNCSAELLMETYTSNHGEHKPYSCLCCPSGDFGTEYGSPTKIFNELKSAYNLTKNNQKVGEVG